MHETATPPAPRPRALASASAFARSASSAGLTQTQLAGERFSKEYISQIERGKTRPTESTIAWLAERLGVDPAFLVVRGLDGGAREGRGAARRVPRRSPPRTSTTRRSRRIRDVPAERRGDRRAGRSSSARSPARRGRCRSSGQVQARRSSSCSARGSSSSAPEFSDLDRADVLFRLAVCRYKLSSISTAIALFDEALELAERSGLPCDLLRSDILQWRSRCHRRLRDYVAAHDDVERALELAQDMGDRAAIANAYFQASLVAQRQGHYVLSRSYAQRAKELYQQLNDERNVGRLLLMLGGLTLLLGDEEQRRRAPEGVLLEGARHRFPRGRRAGARGDRPGSSEPGRVRPGGRARAQGARASAGSGGLPPRSLSVAARTGTSVAGARTAGRGGRVLPGG